jgi:hypothetical protein
MKTKSRIALLYLLAAISVFVPLYYGTYLNEGLPSYQVHARVVPINNITQSDEIFVEARTPTETDGVLKVWDYELIAGGLNETLNGTNIFRFEWEVEVRFFTHNSTHTSRMHRLLSPNYNISYLIWSMSNHSYQVAAWVDIHHSEVGQASPISFEMEAKCKNEQ